MEGDKTEISDIVEEVSRIIDISEWDSRTLKVLRKNPVDLLYFSSLKEYYNPLTIETEYLRHVAQRLSNDGHIEILKEALEIFLLLKELYDKSGLYNDYVIRKIYLLEKTPGVKNAQEN